MHPLLRTVSRGALGLIAIAGTLWLGCERKPPAEPAQPGGGRAAETAPAGGGAPAVPSPADRPAPPAWKEPGAAAPGASAAPAQPPAPAVKPPVSTPPAAAPPGARSAVVAPADAGSFTAPKLDPDEARQIPVGLEMKISSIYYDASSGDNLDKLGELAALYFVHGFPSAAAKCFTRGTQVRPKDQAWWHYKALAHERAGENADAIAAFETALTLNDRYAPTYVHLGTLLLKSDPQRAEALLRQALKLFPTNARAHHTLGLLAESRGQPEEALRSYRRAFGLAPEYAEARRSAARMLEQSGRTAEAQAQLRYAAQARPMASDDPLLSWLLAGGLDPETLCTRAIADAEAGLASQAKLQARVDADSPTFRRAEALLALARDVSNDPLPIALALATLRGMQGRSGEAVAQFQEILRTQPDLLEAKSGLAQAYVDLGKLAEAESLFREILAERPDDILTFVRFAHLMQRLRKPDEPLALIQRAIAADPENATLHYELGRLVATRGQETDAVGHLRRAAELRPEFIQAQDELAHLLRKLGDAAGAQAAWEACLRIDPKFVDGYLALASLFYANRDAAAAIRSVRAGLEQVPEGTPSAAVLANTLAWLLAVTPDQNVRNGAEAVQLAEKASQWVQNRSHKILDTLAAAYAEAGRFDDAVQTAQQAISMANTAGENQDVEAYRQRLQRYEQKQAWHDQ